MRHLDAHVHIVGIGTGGTGCRMRLGGWKAPLEAFMFRHIGLDRAVLRDDFDHLYVERLLELVRGSSLDAAVILAMDDVHDERGAVLPGAGSFVVPNDYVLGLAERYAEFIPAVSIHPARPDALEELDRCLARGAAALKLLPNCHNVDCNDRRYRPFWERMAEAGLPLIAHTGGEHTVPVVNARFADPGVLELPLECGVKVIAAHSATKSGLFDPNYSAVLARMMHRFPNLYADNSAFNIPFRSGYFREALAPPLRDRMLHGSDFPVLVFGIWAWARGLIDTATWRRWEKHPNVLERDYQIKRAIGFPKEAFGRADQVLRLPVASGRHLHQD